MIETMRAAEALLDTIHRVDSEGGKIRPRLKSEVLKLLGVLVEMRENVMNVPPASVLNTDDVRKHYENIRGQTKRIRVTAARSEAIICTQAELLHRVAEREVSEAMARLAELEAEEGKS